MGQARTSPALGAVPEAIDDPAIVMLWGITRENLDKWLDDGNEETTRSCAASPPATAWSKAPRGW